MILFHLIIAGLVLLAPVSQGVALLDLYGLSMQFVQAAPWSLYIWLVVVSCLLVLLTVILEQLKSYELMYFLSRTVYEMSLLGISLLSFWSLFFAWVHLKNLWLDMIPFIFIPYLGIFVAMVMFQLFDFNYPYKKRVVQGVLLSGLTVALVFAHLS